MAEKTARFREDEAGSFTIFCLFLFVTILFIAGMAVDLMRFETRRVDAQNTLDSAILAASSLNQKLDSEELVKDHFTKAGFNADEVGVRGTDDIINTDILVGRTVQAATNIQINTWFMDLLGVDRLAGGAQGTATESVTNVEISMILDISGSMGDNDKLVNLKVAAKNFVDKIYLNTPPGSTTSISIVPYNGTVVVGNDLLKHLNADGETIEIAAPAPYTGAMTQYSTEHNDSTCVRFSDDDMDTRAISETTPLTRVAHFDRGGNEFNTPGMNQRWCNENRAAIMVHSTNPAELKLKIDSLTHGGWTGIDNGMKWGVALLDPAMEPVIRKMNADDKKVSDAALGRPAVYDREKTMKVVVLMTDGANTLQRDLRDPFKNGPSRIWYAESRTSGYDSDLDRNLTKSDGYFVLMPDNDSDKRFYVPGLPTSTGDDFYTDASVLPADAKQLDYLELNRRFSEDDIAKFFFERSDTTAYDAHLDAAYDTESYGSIDDRLQDICDAANDLQRIRVFAIGFEAPQEGLDAMKGCASSIGNYYDVDGKGINQAVDSLAGQISMLRLKE